MLKRIVASALTGVLTRAGTAGAQGRETRRIAKLIWL
jgi:hypothetical protein